MLPIGIGGNTLGGYNITDSLRFRSSANAYLSRTPTTAGNRRTWTWSGWVKRGGPLSGYRGLFQAYSGNVTGGTDFGTVIRFHSANVFSVFDYTNSSFNWVLDTTMRFRDTSAWYHIVVAVDTTQATSSNRVKIWVNGEQVTTFDTATYPSQNLDTYVNNTNVHHIGKNQSSSVTGNNFYDGYMTEVNLVDGQALDASYFGSTNADGVWSPKKYSGTYGTNGFYLPMKETTQATGFNTVIYDGNNGTQDITGVGFSPDLVWIKQRTDAASHVLFDTIRGVGKDLKSNSTDAEGTNSIYGYLSSFNNDGFTVTNGTTNAGRVNETADDYVAWCWDAGSSTVSNTDGTITSSVRANTDKGFSVVTFNAAASGAFTVGHGLGTAPKVVITRYRNIASDWYTYHESIGNTKYLKLNDTIAGTTSSTIWDNTSPTSDVFTLGSSIAGSSSWTMVAYCFSEVSGYSKFGSYTGNGSTSGPTVTTGFRPAFVMIKGVDSARSWNIYDNTRDVDNPIEKALYPNTTDVETIAGDVDFTDTGFEIKNTGTVFNISGEDYIYMAFADTRDFQWNFDASGNKNNWTPNNINSNASSETTYDLMSDTPSLADEDTGNFATLNPLDIFETNQTASDGNLKFTCAAQTNWDSALSTIGVSSGKYYYEVKHESGTYNRVMVGICDVAQKDSSTYTGNTSNGYGYLGTNGQKYNNATTSAYGDTFTVGDVIGVAVDLDNGAIYFSKNGTWQNSGDPTSGATATGAAYTGLSGTYLLGLSLRDTSATTVATINYGQQPFKYTPPTGYKKLNTFNLPDSSITDGSQYMNTVLYTGDGDLTSHPITGVGFSPDWIWIKRRDGANAHQTYDSVRTLGYVLSTNKTDAEADETSKFVSIDSDGFTIKSNAGSHNLLNATYVSWNWRGSDSTAVSNTDGTITSTVSANTTAGFSVVTYTGNGTNPSTIGHGLGAVPKFIISKARTGSPLTTTEQEWNCYSAELGNDKKIILNNTNAVASSSNWGSTTPTSSVYTVGAGGTNGSGSDFVAYCFAEVEGFSKFGSYTGNGSTDGTFIYTGFRPAFVMVKSSSNTEGWYMWDSSRDAYNASGRWLSANASDAELDYTSSYPHDLLSNGFKIRHAANTNQSGRTYIYMAFAENPFKNSLAR